MTSLVFDLQAAAMDPKMSVSDLLRMARVVSSKLGIDEITAWIDLEQGGYKDFASLPEYRHLRGQLMVDNPFHGLQPLTLENEKAARVVAEAPKEYGPIGHIEELLRGSGRITYPLPGSFVQSIMAAGVPLQPVLLVQRASVVGIVEAIRNRVLAWSLDLEKRGVIGEGMTFSRDEREKASHITHNHITIGTMTNSQLQQHSPGAHQSIATGFDASALIALVEAIETQAPSMALSFDAYAELLAEVATLRAQAASPKPKSGVIRESLSSLRNIIEGAAGGYIATLGPPIVAMLSALAK